VPVQGLAREHIPAAEPVVAPEVRRGPVAVPEPVVAPEVRRGPVAVPEPVVAPEVRRGPVAVPEPVVAPAGSGWPESPEPPGSLPRPAQRAQPARVAQPEPGLVAAGRWPELLDDAPLWRLPDPAQEPAAERRLDDEQRGRPWNG
jgi:hypothetical protein